MNDKYQIIIQPEAQKAIEDAYFWFSNISHQKARTWLEGLYKSILSLEKMPSRCSLAFKMNFFIKKYDNLYMEREETPIELFLQLLMIMFKLFLCDTRLKNQSETKNQNN